MAVDAFTKQPYDRIWCVCDFANRLVNVTNPGVPDTIATMTMAAKSHPGGQDAPTVLGSGAAAPSFNGTKVYWLAQDGTSGQVYQYTIQVVTSSGQRVDKDVRMTVTEE